MCIDFQDILSVSEVPYGTLPVLDVDGKILAQSTAIARFVAAECGGYFIYHVGFKWKCVKYPGGEGNLHVTFWGGGVGSDYKTTTPQ